MSYSCGADKGTRWSKLQRDIEKLFDPNIKLKLHCVAYRMKKSRSHNPQIPRIWVQLGKDIIWDWPGSYKDDWMNVSWNDRKHPVDLAFPHEIRPFTVLIRSYIDTPKEHLHDFFAYHEEEDPPQWRQDLVSILRMADRRHGKRFLRSITLPPGPGKVIQEKRLNA